MAGLLHDDPHQRPLHVHHRPRERLDVGADEEPALREPLPTPAAAGEGSWRRRRRAGEEEGLAQRARQLVRAEAEVLVRRAEEGARGGDRRGEGELVQRAGAGGRRGGAVVAAAGAGWDDVDNGVVVLGGGFLAGVAVVYEHERHRHGLCTGTYALEAGRPQPLHILDAGYL